MLVGRSPVVTGQSLPGDIPGRLSGPLWSSPGRPSGSGARSPPPGAPGAPPVSVPVRGGDMVGAGGMETWGGRRSSAYASMCGSLLPFLREGRPGACRIYGVHRGRFLSGPHPPGCMSRAAAPYPFRGGNIEGRPAGGGVRFFSRTGGTHWGTVQNPGALRGRLGAGVVAYVPRYGAYVTLSGSTGIGFVSGALLPLVASRAVCVGRIYFGLWRNYE